MNKDCEICGKPFYTLSTKRKTCGPDCADKLAKNRQHGVSMFDSIKNHCTATILEFQYHGQILPD